MKDYTTVQRLNIACAGLRAAGWNNGNLDAALSGMNTEDAAEFAEQQLTALGKTPAERIRNYRALRSAA